MKYLTYIIIVCGIFISCKHTSSGTTEPKDFLLKITVKKPSGETVPHIRVNGGCMIANQPTIAVQVLKLQLTAHDTGSGNTLYKDSIYVVPTEVDFAKAFLGYTSATGSFEWNDVYRFPGVLNLPVLNQTNESGISSGTFTISSTADFVLMDTVTNQQQSYQLNLKNGHNDFQLTWNPTPSQIPKTVNDQSAILSSRPKDILHSKSILNVIDTSWNNINISDSTGANRTLYLARRSLVANPNYYELPPLPPGGSFDVRFTSQRSLETYPDTLSTDSTYRYRILMQSSHYPLTLHWKFQCPPEFHLSESIDGQAINTRLICSRDSSSIANSNINGLIITIPKSVSTPSNIKLYQNYPNPFSGSTIIPFALPSASKITISIITLNNQLIGKLVNNELFDAGWHVVEYRP